MQTGSVLARRQRPPDRGRPERRRRQQDQRAAESRRKIFAVNCTNVPLEQVHCYLSSANKKAGQGTDISVCALSGCRFSEQLALRRTTVLCQSSRRLTSGAKQKLHLPRSVYSIPCCLHQMSITVSTGRSLTRRTCRRTGCPRMETLFFFLRSFMACAATSSGPYHLST